MAELTSQALMLWNTVRDSACDKCELHQSARVVCMLGNGPVPADGMIVGDFPYDFEREPFAEEDSTEYDRSGRKKETPVGYLYRVLKGNDVDPYSTYRTYAVKCSMNRRSPKQWREKQLGLAIKACADYLEQEINTVRPKAILALGAQAYYYFKHRKGITKNRGQAFEWSTPCICKGDHCEGTGARPDFSECSCAKKCKMHTTWIVPAMHPTAVLMNPHQHSTFVSDITKWWRLVNGIEGAPAVDIVEVRTVEQLDAAISELDEDTDKLLTFDLETRGFKDHVDAYSKVWLGAWSRGRRNKFGAVRVFAIPLEHPESPWFGDEETTQHVARAVVDLTADAERVSGHNVKFDMRFLETLAGRHDQPTRMANIGFDTIIGAHLLDENRGKSLLDQSSTELGVNNWGKGVQRFGTDEVKDLRELVDLKGKGGLTELWGDEGMAYYCARDVAYTHLLYEVQRTRLAADQPVARLAKELVLPGLNAFLRVERNGIWLDTDRVRSRKHEVSLARDNIERELVAEYVNTELYNEWVNKTQGKKNSKPVVQNRGFLVSWLFGPPPMGLGLMPVSYTDAKHEPQVDAAALEELRDAHPALEMLQKYLKHTKNMQFMDSWMDWLGTDGRLHPSFNMTGTVTGRRSCNNPNLQQVPRDPFMRSMLGAPPGRVFLEIDYSQIEVRIAAWLANEEHMLKIFAEGGDIYISTAAMLLGKRLEDVTPEERRKAKAAVLGLLYGMGAKGFVHYAMATYEAEFTLDEANDWRDGYFAAYPGLVSWHQAQERAARASGHVVRSPTGRLRHVMNILSTDSYQVGKAVRQAINSPAQGTGGDYTLAGVVELHGLVAGVPGLDPSQVLITGDIHDAILFDLAEETWVENARQAMTAMENPAIMRKLGVNPTVRMLAEGKASSHWNEPGSVEFTLDGTGGKLSIDEAATKVDLSRAA